MTPSPVSLSKIKVRQKPHQISKRNISNFASKNSGAEAT
jgi:hypothetical protein